MIIKEPVLDVRSLNVRFIKEDGSLFSAVIVALRYMKERF